MIEKRQLTRFIIFIILSTVIVVLILWRYSIIMLLSEPSTSLPARNGAVERGPILDRNGRVLAIQTQLDTVTAWMPSVDDPEGTYQALVRVLDVDEKELKEKFETRTGFFYVKRKISRTESRSLQEVLESENLKGISLIPEYGRAYPEKELASHLIGYAGTDNIGLLGIEYSFDDILYPAAGEDGVRYGNQLFLSIDINLQYILESLARESYEENRPDSITLLAADAGNGEILAYVSIPGFDPNNFSASPPEARFNMPAAAAYEPGSVFKIFSMASFLELGGISPETTFFCNGQYEDVDPHINCLGVHGVVNAAAIIKSSCNAGAGYASETVSREEFYRMITAFGFGARTGAPFPGETYGIVRGPQTWSTRTKPTIAMGQEISVSALQMISAATTLTNRGVLLKPQLVTKIVSPEGRVISEYGREPLRQVISADVAREILLDMESATQLDGTAHRAGVEGLRVSAKTGTAQVTDPETGAYSEENFIASCLSIFPTDNPRAIIYAVIHQPRGEEIFGGRIAAPLASKAAEETARYLGIPRGTEREVTHGGQVVIRRPPPLDISGSLPDLTGRSKRDLLALYGIPDVALEIEGEGWVRSQTPPPGTPITPGMRITVELE
jgi:cell division protein FtsI (penicillin-binding protein 3)